MINSILLKKLMPATIVALGIFMAMPTTKGVAKSELISSSGRTVMVAEFNSIEDLSESVRKTIHPTLVNQRDMVYSALNYDHFRVAYGKSDDWLNKFSTDGETFKQRIEKQVEADAKAVSNLVSAIKLTATSQVSRGHYKVTDYIINQTDTLKFDSEYLSKDLAIIASDPLQAAIAFHNKRYFHGTLPANYIFNSYGKYTLKRELDMTTNHLLRHHEYWFDFIFVDDFFENKVGQKVSKFNYIYE